MAIDFPNSPSVGQLFTTGDITRRWDGTTWSIVPTTIQGVTGAKGPQGLAGAQGLQGTAGKFSTGTTAPVSPATGDVWFNTEDAIIYVYYDGYWVEWSSATTGAPARENYYWYRESIYSEYRVGIDQDSDGNIYASDAYGIIKLNRKGNKELYKEIKTSSISRYIQPVHVDNSNNIFFGVYDPEILIKTDSNLNILWQKEIDAMDFMDIKCDISGNPYIVLATNGGGSGIIKFNSSGTVQWQKELNVGIYRSFIDSSSNIYLGGDFQETDKKIFIGKYNSSGTLQWQKVIYLSGQDLNVGLITLDESENIYVSIDQTTVGNLKSYIVKLDSSGNILWQKDMGQYMQSIDFEFYNNYIYCVGNKMNGNTFAGLVLFKLDTSGNVIWSTLISNNNNTPFNYPPFGKTISIFDEVISTSVSGKMSILQYPIDGSILGDFINYKYSRYTISPTTSSLTIGTASRTETTPSYTISNGTAVISDLSVEQYTYPTTAQSEGIFKEQKDTQISNIMGAY